MRTTWPTLLKLLTLCALIWVQATQAEHGADTVLDAGHSDCVVCKNISDPLSDGTSAPELAAISFDEAGPAPLAHQRAGATTPRSSAPRAPPFTA